MEFTIKSNFENYNADSKEGRQNVKELTKKYEKAFRRIGKEYNAFVEKCVKLGYPSVFFVLNPYEGLMLPASNIAYCQDTDLASDLFSSIMADGICQISLQLNKTPDEVLAQIKEKVEELKAIQAENIRREKNGEKYLV